MRYALVIVVLGVGFLLSTQVTQAQSESKSKRSFLELVNVGDRISITYGRESQLATIKLFTEAQAKELEQRQRAFEGKLQELAPRIEPLKEQLEQNESELKELMVSSRGLSRESRRAIIEKIQPLEAEQQRLRQELEVALQPAERLRPETTYEVIEVGEDFIGYSSPDRITYLPLHRIVGIYTPVENPPQPDATE